ncbi:MAG: TIGR00725 family protein [Dehalococcoidia bacterium]
MLIGVIGGGNCSSEGARMAEAVGHELAKNGATLVCGGLGGVMEAACKGAKEAGGLTIGILPGNDKTSANPYVDIPIVTGMGEMRNVIIIKSVQAAIAIEGEFGTLSEIAHCFKWGVPVVGLNTWEFSRQGQVLGSVIKASSPQDAVEKALATIN